MDFSRLNRFFPFFLIAAFSIIFLLNLFLPPSAYVNPDFGLSDPLHIWLPNKYVYSQNIKKLEIPLWEMRAGNGFPIHAELLDMYYLPNLLIFFVLPFNYAIPTSYLAIYLIAGTTMYFLLKNLGLRKGARLLGSLSFMFSAAIVLRAQHPNIAQAMALVPASFLFYFQFLKTEKFKYIVLAAVVSTQILFSFPQIFFYNTLFLAALNTPYLAKSKRTILKIGISFVIFILLTIGLSSIQLLPSFEITQFSNRNQGLDSKDIISSFPYQPSNLLTFINPYILGKAANGTYNSLDWQKYGLFWENTAYIGLLPFLIFILSSFVLLKNKQKTGVLILIFFVISVFMALGKYAPTHILFIFPPLNYFRVPARFILFAQFFAVILFAFGADWILKKRINKKFNTLLFILMLTLLIGDLFMSWYNYNPTRPVKDLTISPEIISFIPQEDRSYRIYSLDMQGYWNKVFTKKGWQGEDDYYHFFLNSLSADNNILYGLNQISSYQVLPSRRQTSLDSFITSGITVKNQKININNVTKNLLNFYSVKYLITTNEIENKEYQKITAVKKDEYKYYLYKNPSAQNLAEVYYDFKNVQTVNEYKKAFGEENIADTLLVENLPQNSLERGAYQIDQVKIKQNSFSLKAETDKEGFLTIKQSYFPGWSAKIDGAGAKINPVDLNAMAIKIGKGSHLVEFNYRPKTLTMGILITILSVIISMLIIFKTQALKFFHGFI
ncbi:YfhO family protein [Candidatus Curtissbacteria bacterium]|nr:YfhO family protein [Candidatus Curtissbacteria bacterium]